MLLFGNFLLIVCYEIHSKTSIFELYLMDFLYPLYKKQKFVHLFKQKL